MRQPDNPAAAHLLRKFYALLWAHCTRCARSVLPVTQALSEIMNPSKSEIDELYNLVGIVASYEDDAYLNQLLEYVEKLNDKYGASPVLLSTKADFIDDIKERLQLYHRVIELSKNPIEPAYITQSIESVLCIYIDDLSDYDNSKKWLDKLRESIEQYGDSFLIYKFSDLQDKVNRLNIKTV